MDAQFYYWSASELARAIQAGEISPVEVLEAHVARIEAVNADLNALVTLDVEGARRRAAEAEKALAQGMIWGPLHGVPFTLKDCHSTAGLRTTAGFPPLADYIPPEDGTISARLKAAGAILLGKTNVPVLLGDIQTDNPIFGRSNNPWDLSRTPGGSSGGAAAALASGMTPIEVGSDIGGSIRIPAHFCGVFGLKATERRISHYGHIPEPPGATRAMRIIASLGPMARTIEDLSLIYSIIAGPDGRDFEVPPVPVVSSMDIDLADCRIAWATDFPGWPVSKKTGEAIEKLAASLEPHCKVVASPQVPDLEYDRNLLSVPDRMAIGALQPGQDRAEVDLKDYFEALQVRDKYVQAWHEFFEEWDALLCPVSSISAFPHWQTGEPLPLDDGQMDYWLANAHCKLFNYTGQPALALPYDYDEAGLPLGVQLVGKRWQEAKLLSLGSQLVELTGAFEKPPGY